MKNLQNAVKGAVVAAGLAGVSAAHAVDITSVSTELAEGLTNVQTIGAAVLLIAVAVAVFKYVKKAL